MLVTSIFSFCHNVFYTSQNKYQFLSHIYFIATKLMLINLKLCHLERSQGPELMFSVCIPVVYTSSLCNILVFLGVSRYQFYVYCKICQSLEPGKLRVRCVKCLEGGVILEQVCLYQQGSVKMGFNNRPMKFHKYIM